MVQVRRWTSLLPSGRDAGSVFLSGAAATSGTDGVDVGAGELDGALRPA